MERLRCVTWLSPGIPRELFEVVVRRLGMTLGLRTELRSEETDSGPPHRGPDPFSTGQADLGFLCSPPYLWLREREPPPVVLVAAPVFDDPRFGGRPVYFAEVVVRADHPARRLEDLAGSDWAYNDRCSLSGFFSIYRRVARLPGGAAFLGSMIRSGGHLDSLALLLDGFVEAAALDSNVLLLQRRARPDLAGRIRVLESWGPYPVQPVVARAGLPAALRKALADALHSMAAGHGAAAELARFGLAGFAPVADADYEGERAALEEAEALSESPA